MNQHTGRNRKASAIGTVLVVVSLLAILGLALAGAGINHLQLASFSDNGQRALNLARSAVAQTLAEVQNDEGFGLEDEVVEVHLPDYPTESYGRVTFATGSELLASVNNLESTETTPGSGGRVVPPASIHLVAVGECRGVRRIVEAIYHRPAFPYALASNGPVRFEGEVTIAGVDEDYAVEGLLDPEELDRDLPADLASHHPEDPSVVLGPSVTITGDVEAAGEVVLNGAHLGGDVRPARDLELPVLEPARLDPAQGERTYRELSEEHYNEEDEIVLSGAVRRDGDLVVESGLDLNGSFLFVEGNLTVRGGARGRGVMVATGDITIEGGTRLESSNLAALVAGGDVALTGEESSTNFFRGVVATQGTLIADQITVVGTLLASRQQEVLLREARLINDTRSVEVELPDRLAEGTRRVRVMQIPGVVGPVPYSAALAERFGSAIPYYVTYPATVNEFWVEQPGVWLLRIDPSRFLQTADSLKLRLWKES